LNEFKEEIKRKQEEKELLESELENIKLERSNFIEDCFLGKTYEELMKVNITLDFTRGLHFYFLHYIQRKEELPNRIIKRRFRKEVRKPHPKIALLRRLEFDIFRKDLTLEETPLVELPHEQWQEVKEVLLLIKRNIQPYIIRHHQIELKRLNSKIKDIKGEKSKEA